MIRVVIGEDHAIVIDGLCSILEKDPEIEVVGTAMNGRGVLNLLEKYEVDIAILDVKMPEMNGIEATIEIRRRFPNVKVLILTMFNNHKFIVRLVEAGARGYILKNRGKEELLKAVHKIQAGKRHFGEEITDIVMDSLESKKSSGVVLTEREIDVLKLIAQGLKSKEISEKLFISPATVETHRAHLLTKLDIPSSLGLVRYAIENGYC